MSGNISKNAKRTGSQELLSRWGGKIIMKSVFKRGRIYHYAECSNSKETARKPSMLM